MHGNSPLPCWKHGVRHRQVFRLVPSAPAFPGDTPVAREGADTHGTYGGGTAPDLHGIPYSPIAGHLWGLRYPVGGGMSMKGAARVKREAKTDSKGRNSLRPPEASPLSYLPSRNIPLVARRLGSQFRIRPVRAEGSVFTATASMTGMEWRTQKRLKSTRVMTRMLGVSFHS